MCCVVFCCVVGIACCDQTTAVASLKRHSWISFGKSQSRHSNIVPLMFVFHPWRLADDISTSALKLFFDLPLWLLLPHRLSVGGGIFWWCQLRNSGGDLELPGSSIQVASVWAAKYNLPERRTNGLHLSTGYHSFKWRDFEMLAVFYFPFRLIGMCCLIVTTRNQKSNPHI